jgi:hypothetical protein
MILRNNWKQTQAETTINTTFMHEIEHISSKASIQTSNCLRFCRVKLVAKFHP